MKILRQSIVVIFLSVFSMSAQSPISFAQGKIDSVYLKAIDSIVNDAIQQQAFPGLVLLVARNDTVVFNKAYGFHTYDSLVKVKSDDLYDLASVTKIMGPLPAIMKLVEEKKIDLDVPFSRYWKSWRRIKDKKYLTLREMLAHQAGLSSYIVFLNHTLKKNGKPKRRFIRTKLSKRFNKQVYDGIYVKHNFNRYMYRKIRHSIPLPEKKYVYSGLSFLIFPELIEQRTGSTYEAYIKKHFYTPLGVKTLGFNPKSKHFSNAIVPTEKDSIFRHALTKGYVHDENAALLGGVSGNAGLFGTADDLLKMMLFYQHYGEFNGKRLLSDATVKEFNRVQFYGNDNRRGLGFDKPLFDNDKLSINEAYPAPSVSPESFGHSGFTGTFVWTDPVKKITFIFLSNRVYPTRAHRNIYNLTIRPKLQEMFYQALCNNAVN
ncbi:beta-lactamase family protein [Flavobacteriaceae bacterium F08102]|nr:beta-lactamase family protein [Flavobacteriaceae bacterium F08102]